MKTLTTAAVLVLLINGVCIFAAGKTGNHYWYYAMFGIAATGLITFFGILIQDLQSETDTRVSNRSMRLAITGLITSAYIVLLAYLLFIPANTELAAVAETLVTSFTAVVGTVVAFFFGSAAYVEARTNQTRDNNGPAD